MPRSIGIFRKVGFRVEPYPVNSKPVEWPDFLVFNFSFLDRVARTDIAAREWIGLLAYRLTGRTSELLPSPEPKND
jgi:uncharacterized SAM-binding protein YcdF (DUF218 family)